MTDGRRRHSHWLRLGQQRRQPGLVLRSGDLASLGSCLPQLDRHPARIEAQGVGQILHKLVGDIEATLDLLQNRCHRARVGTVVRLLKEPLVPQSGLRIEGRVMVHPQARDVNCWGLPSEAP